jgi:tetratricopeptide (TPR) repeat protein
MDTLHDRCGLAVSTRSPEALACVDSALSALLAGRAGVATHLDAALRHDPACVIALCMRAAAGLVGGERANDPAVTRVLRKLRRVRAHANDREERHAAAVEAWRAGDARTALACYSELLIDHPRDTLALQMAHALDFRLGQREMLRDRVAQVLPSWHEGIAGYGHVLALYAFGLEETGDYAQAESLARRALALSPDSAAATHVIAHVLEMQGRTREGVEWLESTRAVWSAQPGFAIHNAWHLALFHLDRARADLALAIYDRALRPTSDSPQSALVDAAALLWRLHLHGWPLGERWEELAGCWQRKRLRGARAFNLVHAVLAFAAAGRQRLARRAAALLSDDALTRSLNEPADLALAVPLCEALQAFAGGDYGVAVERIVTVRAMAEHCGGSVAQCDLIHLTLIEAALRSRRMRLAQALAAERTARKPESLLNRRLFARARAFVASLDGVAQRALRGKA